MEEEKKQDNLNADQIEQSMKNLNIQGPSDQQMNDMLLPLGGTKDDFDIIKKPRTNFTNNALRRAIPNLNIQDKLGSISMNKLNVLSAMRLGTGSNSSLQIKTIKTVANLPKIQSLDSRMMSDILQKGNNHDKNQNTAKKKKSGELDQIEEGRVADESQDYDSSDDRNDKKSDSDSGDESDSSIDLDGKDEEKLYQKILQEQDQAASMNEAKDKGEHLNDLVDKEMIALLNVCKRLHCPRIESLESKYVYFGENPLQKKTLILDMDETMLHAKFLSSEKDEQNDDGDYVFTLQSETSGSADVEGTPSDSLKVSIKMRPFLDMALDFLAKYYEICVFTAGTQDYADACLDYLDPERQVIKHRLYRQHCVNPYHGVYVKDLRIIRDRDIKNIIIVDNSIISFAYQMDNGIPIKAYMRQQNDEELLFMVTFLEEIFSYADPRVHISKTFCLKHLMNTH